MTTQPRTGDNEVVISVRKETAEDVEAVRNINVTAFDTTVEAELVDILREVPGAISLVASVAPAGNADDASAPVVGHILFSPATVPSAPELRVAGLAPMAVLPAFQGNAVGASLVEAGLATCRNNGIDVVIVLGHPEYYPRFGFRRASELGLECQFEVPDEAFMAIELTPGCLDDISGVARYHPAFDELA